MRTAPFHVRVKPTGPLCNLDCRYYYHLEREKLFPQGHSFRMVPDVLEAFVRQYIASQPTPEITFA